MSVARSISDAEWEVHKKDISRLYQNQPLSTVMAVMEQDHGFIAKLQWKLSKNSTGDKWKFVARKLEKRKHEGKESATYIDGKLIPKKKIRREISRYCSLSSSYTTLHTAPSPEPLPGVEVCTPAGGAGRPQIVDYLHIPWFEFEILFQSQAIEFTQRQPSRQYPALSAWNDRNFPGFLDNYSINSPVPQMQLPEQQWSLHGVEATPQTDVVFDFLSGNSDPYLSTSIEATDEFQSSLTPHTSDEEARSIFANILGDPYTSLDENNTLGITSRLDGILPERQYGEVVHNVKKIFDLSSMVDASLQLLPYAIFLSSNNLLRCSQIDKLLRWMIETDQSFLIERLIRIKSPTVEIFLSHLLLSATRLQNIDMVLAVIAQGIDVNTAAGDEPKVSALYEATVRESVHLVRLLLNAGANPNASITSSLTRSPLQVAVSSKNHEIVKMLLDAGGDPNVMPGGLWSRKTLLASAASSQDAALVKILLEAKAEVNMMTQSSVTALQEAAYANNVEHVQLLLDAGADVDAPFGNQYQTARLAAAKERGKHLVSSIQFAAYNNNIEMVQMLLDADANVDGYALVEGDAHPYGDDDEEDDFFYKSLQTPLQLAVSNENGILVRLLLLSGADANAQKFGDTPLQIAARNDDVALVRLLLRNGAYVNAAARKKGGRTALQSAASTGNNDLVQILLDEGADVNALPAYENGRTAIQAAAQGGHAETLRILRDLGADVNAKASPRGGRTCLQTAAENSDTEMIRLLLRFRAEVNAPAASEMGRTALQAAVQGHNSAGVDVLLNAGADINAAPSKLKGMSALYGAVRNNDLELSRRLLVTGDPNGATSRHSPIVKAAKRGNFDLVRSLIDAGADANALGQTRKRQFALQAAVGGGNIEVIRILLEAQVDVNASTIKYSLTPLELAIQKNRVDMVRLLLKNGASVNPALSVKRPATTALGVAMSRFSVNLIIVEDLIEAGADINRGSSAYGLPLYAAAHDYSLTKRLLDAGANVNGQWPDYPSPLQRACAGLNIDTIRLLLGAGADINAPASPKYGRTALQAAAQRGNPPIVNLLLQHGANCNELAAEFHGATALQFAALEGRISIVLLLLRAGAEINAAPSITGGRTALEAAAEHGRLDVVSLLLKNDTDMDGLNARCQRAAKLAAANDHVIISRLLREYKQKDTE
ncbi:Ankyrin-1 [Lachnellula hyalina]|uniref:Ankyrin-1 n=1 Tax=Lachnellula hyalina TaxID=1316788 RepID=A0A8H8TYT6_9HELO|nr:Ankyrin-1 [Lachnellula hyalina]TVY25720.1 Ankyrin-1 [Lachnellula hyalina]